MGDHSRTAEDGLGVHNSLGSLARLSPTITRAYNPTDPQNLERQRTMDADFAMQLCEWLGYI